MDEKEENKNGKSNDETPTSSKIRQKGRGLVVDTLIFENELHGLSIARTNLIEIVLRHHTQPRSLYLLNHARTSAGGLTQQLIGLVQHGHVLVRSHYAIDAR